jgi:glucuronoarabinoxylan endo-1,4-beta-xylanase
VIFPRTLTGIAPAFVAFGFALSACAFDVGEEPILDETLGVAPPDSTSVCWRDLRQTISGFGASSAWTAPDLPDELADELFSVDRIGLSLVRLRIAPNGVTGEVATALKAQERGARVWAAPWSPPGTWKTNGTDNYGGALLPERYPDWAERLATFVRSVEDEGVELLALSVQNEPDFVAEWETCEWAPNELATFVANHLVPALNREGVRPRLLAPETGNWGSVARYGEVLLAHRAAAPAIGIVATHGYGRIAPYAYVSPAAHGKELWMTEWSDSTAGGPDAGMGSGLVVARAIHDNLTVAEVNAWHYWWLLERTDTAPARGGLLSNDELTRRAYVTGQWSRFVRPGSRRIRMSSSDPQPGVRTSAFLRDGSELVLVAINENTTSVTQSFDFQGAEVGELAAYVTNDELALEEQPSIPGGPFATAELSARSVTTFTAPVTIDTQALSTEACARPQRVITHAESTDTGCSCRQANGSRGSVTWLALSVLVGALGLRRRLLFGRCGDPDALRRS